MSAETASSTRDDAAAAKLLRPGSPLAFIIDNESSIRQFISLILQGNGIDTLEFADGTALRKTRSSRPPDIVFLNVNTEIQDAIQTVEALGKTGFTGAVQLISGRGAAVLDAVRQVGDKFKLQMLSPLSKPFETAAIQKIIDNLKLSHQPPSEVKVDLAEALKRDWVEFWYQPKIDLGKKQLAGAEAFARVNHPQHGILPPSSFMGGASDAGLLSLAEQALVSALKSGLNLSRLGVNLRMAVNVSMSALQKLPIDELVRGYRPQVKDWPGLIIDIPEEQIVGDVTRAVELARKFSEHNVMFAIDDFGRHHETLAKVKELPFAEMKLDRAFVTGCAGNKNHASLCKAAIELAHRFGSLAVGIGLESASDTLALIDMGCDLGQGFLFGQPMPEERFISVLKQRATVRASNAPGPLKKSA
jgi:EAL domain-containing protein (putative c-di-GMP-specific phosphodiesterase class I)/FixJ family two-component response regulator